MGRRKETILQGGKDRRGPAHQRRARRKWLIDTFGNGTTVMCVHGCGTELDCLTLEVDRITPGGSYRHDNIQPSCPSCNRARGDDPDWRYAPEHDS